MASDSDSCIPSFMSLCASLLISFTILKILGMLTFSWWFVLAPLWIPLGIYALVGLVVGIAVVWLNYTFRQPKKGKPPLQ